MKDYDFSDTQLQQFKDNGYVVLENYYTVELCDSLRHECSRLIDDMNPAEHRTVFSCGKHEYMTEDYFLTSGDKIRFFWEKEAVNEQGDLLKPKQLSVNKMGHALHILNPAFKNATFNGKIDVILQKLEYVRPTIPQSMYIFKQPGIGDSVSKHIDASFLESIPQKLTGFWVALEDTTPENGCLWFARGSHKNGEITYRMIRNEPGQSPNLIFTGKLEEIEDEKFVPVPVKKGSLIVIDGKVQHKSSKNKSDRSRHVYTFHATESYQTKWSEKNWIQPTKDTPFPVVYDKSPVQCASQS